MYYIPTLLAALLTGPALAFPGYFQPMTAPIPTGNIPRPPLSTSVSNPGPCPESPSDGGEIGSTITDTITKTSFVPYSTPVASSGTRTWYSTLLTATRTSTTCYTEPTIPQSTTSTSTPSTQPNETCPPRATVTVTVTTTTQNGPSRTDSSEAPSSTCQTLTFTDVEGVTRTTTVLLPPTTAAKTLVRTTSSTCIHSTPTDPSSNNSPVPSGNRVRRTLAVPYPVYF